MRFPLFFAAWAIGLFGAAGLAPPAALALEESDISKAYELLEDGGGYYRIESFQGQGGDSLQSLKFGSGKGPKGSLAFISGWGENLLKYLELFYDLNLMGWSPIYTYDHRGQGFSGRILPSSKMDTEVGYVEDYGRYKGDLEAFVRFISSDPDFQSEKAFLIAHSMGGLIVADYLQSHPDQEVFQAAALSSPMFWILSRQPPLVESALLGMIKLYCLLGGCLKPVFDVDPGRSRKDQRTGSQARFSFSGMAERKLPQARLRRPSFHWVLESFKAGRRILERQELEPARFPIMILQAESEYLVSNPHQNQFCRQTPECCHIEKIPGRHEHFMETDKHRDQAIQKTLDFFSESGSRRRRCLAAERGGEASLPKAPQKKPIER